MRLTCPRCGAQYEIDAAAIPAAGRDVECSACDHVWRAMPAAEPFDPAARPSLSRPLSESVIEILRAEAARELEVRAEERRTRRAAERAGEPAAGLDGGAQVRPAASPDAEAGRVPPVASGGIGDATADDGDDPMTRPPGTDSTSVADTALIPATQDLGAARGSDLDELVAASPGAPGLRPVPAGASAVEASPAPRHGAGDTTHPDAQPSRLPAASQLPLPAHGQAGARETARNAQTHPALSSQAQVAPVTPRMPLAPGDTPARRGYATGFGLAVMIALVALALYALAPRVAEQGPLGAALAGWRAEVDRGRDWLSGRAEALTGSPHGAQRGE